MECVESALDSQRNLRWWEFIVSTLDCQRNLRKCEEFCCINIRALQSYKQWNVSIIESVKGEGCPRTPLISGKSEDGGHQCGGSLTLSEQT